MNSETENSIIHFKPAVQTALLSATAGRAGESETGAALLQVAGGAFIEFQINQLARLGIKRILLEIDTVPGAILPVADRARAKGIAIELIRSPADLNGKFVKDDLLFVMAEGVFLDDKLLSEMLAQTTPFLVTLDGRNENSDFERIDLNSFWSGLALLGPASIDGIAALPEDWSISSSLLRRALQDSVLHRPLKQTLVDAQQLRKLRNDQDAKSLSDALLSEKAKRADGWVEKNVFAPVAILFAKLIWHHASGRMIFEIWAAMIALAVLLTGYFGQSILFAVSSLIAILNINIRRSTQQTETKDKLSLAANYLNWAILGSALLLLIANAEGDLPFSLFPSLVMIGLLLLSAEIAKPGWPRLILCSPALAALMMLVFGLLDNVPVAIMVIALAQLFILLCSAKSAGFWKRS